MGEWASMAAEVGPISPFVLFDLLKRQGLNPGDYNVVGAGGVLERWERLRQRQHDSTMLLAPFDILAKANGFNVLQYALDASGQGDRLLLVGGIEQPGEAATIAPDNT
jgi:hypothetical protein